MNDHLEGLAYSLNRTGFPHVAGPVIAGLVGEIAGEVPQAISRDEPIPRPINWKERRIAKRHVFSSKSRGVCYKNTCDLGQKIALELVDISETGIQFVAQIVLAKNQEILILLEGLRHLRPIKAPGAVVRCVALPDNAFKIGVRFNKYLSYKDLTYLT
jgi:hypothetical protein